MLSSLRQKLSHYTSWRLHNAWYEEGYLEDHAQVLTGWARVVQFKAFISFGPAYYVWSKKKEINLEHKFPLILIDVVGGKREMLWCQTRDRYFCLLLYAK